MGDSSQLIQKDVSLQSYNTFGLDVRSAHFMAFQDVEQLKFGLKWADEKQLDTLVLGGGSNVLLTQDVEGLVLKNDLTGISVVEESDEFVSLKVAGGEVWHDLVLYTIDQGWGGVENMSLIPGSVGAAPMQNIGAYGVEIKDVFESLEALNVETFEVEAFDNEACQFGYRESVFKRELKGKYIITSVTIKLSKAPEINVSYGAIKDVLSEKGIAQPTIKDVSEAVIQIRQFKLPDPAEIGNSGSFFKNPVVHTQILARIQDNFDNVPHYVQSDSQVKVPAGWLIEQAGWKGKKRGVIGVHDKQALVLVNHGGGRGQDIKNLSEDIKASVMEKFNIQLETEVNIY